MAKHRTVGDVRGKGLLMGIEMVSDQQTKATFPSAQHAAFQLAEICLRRGLVIYPGGGTADGGGVHLNANILDQWLYLWLNGGINRTSQIGVTGLTQRLGEEDAFRMGERAYYRAITTYMTPNSSFESFRAAMLQSVADLAGQESAEFSEAWDAFEAIGLR